MKDRVQLYKELADKYNNESRQVKSKIGWIAALRLTAFVVLLYSVYSAFANPSVFFNLLIVASLIIFLWLVKLSSTLTAKKKWLDNLVFINQNELDIEERFKNKFYSGNGFDESVAYYQDLDIFGEGSLYQLINRSNTKVGQQALADLFKHSLTQPDEIQLQQKAIENLAQQNNQRQNIIAGAMAIGDEFDEINSLEQWVKEPAQVLSNNWLMAARVLLPLLNFAAIVAWLIYDLSYPLSITVLLSWLHIGKVARHTQKQTMLLSKKQETINAYAGILKNFAQVTTGDSILLQQLHERTKHAASEIFKLSRLVNLLDQRLNMLVNIFLNSFVVYDIQCVVALERWKQENKDQLTEWIKDAGTIENLVSLATYAFNHPENAYPVVDEKPGIYAEGLYHPLIDKRKNVGNPITIGESHKLMLITGSNMSGKTTYLRSVGTNVLMAQCGLPVCATSFRFSPLHIYSSIRVSDSLQENTSYFMAELKRLHYIVKSLGSNQPALVLIDEILRGTNSEDKYTGSYQFVQQLLNYNCLTLFATHDLALSKMEDENPGAVKNYCFESVISNGELNFDYRILPGVAKNRNATFLMKKMQII